VAVEQQFLALEQQPVALKQQFLALKQQLAHRLILRQMRNA
jgi:hypothetical protein